MNETREFHIGDILSVTTGRLVSARHMDGIYEILNWMTGDDLMTHQLPRASRECEQPLRDQFPDLAAVVPPEDFGGKEDVLRWLAEQVDQYGATRDVTPLGADEHTRIDPFTEMRMIKPDAEIIAVVVPDAEETGQ